MESMMELNFGSPVRDDITKPGGEFGAPRHYGGHKGVDFRSNRFTRVKAIEWGIVVCSTVCEGSKERTNYGNVVVIDYTPYAGAYQRHVYSLSAHLERRGVRKDQEVDKGESIGITGNSGTRQSYSDKPKADQKGYHLHFEIIDSPVKLDWNGRNFHALSLRENPMSAYIGCTLIIDYSRLAGKLSGAEPPSWYDPFY